MQHGRVSISKDLQSAKTSALISLRQACRKGVHTQYLDSCVGYIHIDQRFATFKGSMAYVTCILSKFHLLDATGKEAALWHSSLRGS